MTWRIDVEVEVDVAVIVVIADARDDSYTLVCLELFRRPLSIAASLPKLAYARQNKELSVRTYPLIK